jgi:hypothetical protein
MLPENPAAAQLPAETHETDPKVAGAPEAFVVSEKNGSWGTAIEVPGGFAPAS